MRLIAGTHRVLSTCVMHSTTIPHIVVGAAEQSAMLIRLLMMPLLLSAVLALYRDKRVRK